MNKKIRILHLEDSQKDSELIHSLIKSGEIEFDYFFTDNEKDYLHILEKENIDLILSDFSLPDYNGNDALKVAREKYAHIPFIFVSGMMGEDAAINSMLSGATDYVLKNKLERLVPAIKRGLYQSDIENKRKQAEKALKESQQMLHQAQKLAHLGVWDWKADVDLVTWTEELYLIAGLDPKLPAPTYAEHSTIYSPKSWHLLKTAVEKAMTKGEPYQLELELIRPDGSIRNVNAFGGANVDNNGQINGLYGTVQDITESKQAEELLFKSEEKYRNIFENVQDVYYEASIDGTILEVSPSIEIISKGQYHRHDLIGKSMYDFYFITSGRQALLALLQERGSVTDYEIILKNRDGSQVPCSISAKIQFDAHGEPLKIIGSMHDITERKQAEQELIIAKEKSEESDNLKTAFLNNLSHEIRTPMNQILGFASLLKDPDITDSKRDNYIEIINDQSYQLLQIITEIVDISEITTGQVHLNLGTFNLGKMMDELLASFKLKAEQRNLQLRLTKKIADADAMIRGDQVKLNHVFSNIIENAIKFTDEGAIDIEYSRVGNRLIIAVKDTGIGIGAIEKQVIFDNFRQIEITMAKKYSGLGLGLSISDAYIRMMSGEIRVESEPGEGSTFIVEIPYLPAIQVSEPIIESVQPPVISRLDWQNKTLLIAEDEESNAQFLEVVLQSTGIRLLFAVNGLEAVEQCKIHPEIAVVLMDIKMPRMDGLEATRIIKSFRNDLPIIATTAFASASDKEYILNAGCDDYLPKPLKRDVLITKIQKYI